MDKKIIAFVGMPGSGKTTCVEYLQAKDIPSVYFGSIVVEEAKRRNNGIPSEKYERIVREEFRQEDGMAAIAIRATPKIDEYLNLHDRVIADGLYSWDEYKTLSTKYGDKLVTIAITAPRASRYERLATRPKRPLTADEANARDIAEIENLDKGGPIAIADYTIVNNSTQDELIAKLTTLLAELKIL